MKPRFCTNTPRFRKSTATCPLTPVRLPPPAGLNTAVPLPGIWRVASPAIQSSVLSAGAVNVVPPTATVADAPDADNHCPQ